MLNAGAFYNGLEVRVKTFNALIGCFAPKVAWLCGQQHLHDRRSDCLSLIDIKEDCPAFLGNYINHGEKVSHLAICPLDTLHVGHVGYH